MRGMVARRPVVAGRTIVHRCVKQTRAPLRPNRTARARRRVRRQHGHAGVRDAPSSRSGSVCGRLRRAARRPRPRRDRRRAAVPADRRSEQRVAAVEPRALAPQTRPSHDRTRSCRNAPRAKRSPLTRAGRARRCPSRCRTRRARRRSSSSSRRRRRRRRCSPAGAIRGTRRRRRRARRPDARARRPTGTTSSRRAW